jgi:hypothetical protein
LLSPSPCNLLLAMPAFECAIASLFSCRYPDSRHGSGKSIRELFRGDPEFFDKPMLFVVKLGAAAGYRLEIEEYFHEPLD